MQRPPRARRAARRGGAVLVLAAAALLAAAATIPMPRPVLPPREGPAIAAARSWGYQLQRLDPASIPAGADVLVMDYSRDGSGAGAWRPEEIEALKVRPDGSRRIVLSYISIGEAETYRYYWLPHWRLLAPSWLGPENPQWKGNHPVRFWHSGWQRTILEPQPSTLSRILDFYLTWRRPYLDRILEAGFDGIYLDRVDVFHEWLKERPQAQDEMIAFVGAISAYVKARRPGFLVVPQNAEELLASKPYRATIDAIAKEDLWFGVPGDGKRNSDADITSSISYISEAQADRLPVFVVEYLDDPGQRAEALAEARRQGFVLVFARRPLDQPPEPLPASPPPDATPALPVAPAPVPATRPGR